MKTLSKKLHDLYSEGKSKIISLIFACEIESSNYQRSCLPVKNEKYMYNLDGSRYLTEVHAEGLVDNQGYEYQFTVLDHEQLFELFDHLIKEYNEKDESRNNSN